MDMASIRNELEVNVDTASVKVKLAGCGLAVV
jgi:hypothetical protein